MLMLMCAFVAFACVAVYLPVARWLRHCRHAVVELWCLKCASRCGWTGVRSDVSIEQEKVSFSGTRTNRCVLVSIGSGEVRRIRHQSLDVIVILPPSRNIAIVHPVFSAAQISVHLSRPRQMAQRSAPQAGQYRPAEHTQSSSMAAESAPASSHTLVGSVVLIWRAAEGALILGKRA